MVSIEEVKTFLEQFNVKAQIFGIRFRNDREKNKETLRLLEISPLQREVIVKNLQVQDYVEGPIIDVLNKEGEMWVFGKDVKEREVYIKITLGYENGQKAEQNCSDDCRHVLGRRADAHFPRIRRRKVFGSNCPRDSFRTGKRRENFKFRAACQTGGRSYTALAQTCRQSGKTHFSGFAHRC